MKWENSPERLDSTRITKLNITADMILPIINLTLVIALRNIQTQQPGCGMMPGLVLTRGKGDVTHEYANTDDISTNASRMMDKRSKLNRF